MTYDEATRRMRRLYADKVADYCDILKLGGNNTPGGSRTDYALRAYLGGRVVGEVREDGVWESHGTGGYTR